MFISSLLSDSFVSEQVFNIKPLKDWFYKVLESKNPVIQLSITGFLNMGGDRWNEKAAALCLNNFSKVKP